MAEQGAPNIVKAQLLLRRVGFPAGTLDGVIGPATRDAIVAFQRDAGLPADGQLGAQTLAALEQRASGDTIQPSPSVSRYAYDPAPLTASGLAAEVYALHSDYPDFEQVLGAVRAAPDGGEILPIAEWVERVVEAFDPAAFDRLGEPPLLHGRLLVYGLARLDPSLHAALSTDGVLAALRSSITPDPEQLLRLPAPELAEWPISATNWDVLRVIDEMGQEVLGQRLDDAHVLTTGAVLDPRTTVVTVVDPVLETTLSGTVVERIDAGGGPLLIVRLGSPSEQVA